MRILSKTLLTERPDLPHGPAPKTRRVLQFGEGGFLRAFVDQMLDAANEALGLDLGVVVVQPIPRGALETLRAQDHLYTVLLRGISAGRTQKERRIITCLLGSVNPYTEYGALLAEARNPDLRFIVSNTTEAGIVYTGEDRFEDTPPASFPGKLTRFLYERYTVFSGDPARGLVLLPCELIDGNGDALREAVRRIAQDWALPEDFLTWLSGANLFCNTLVDRIVTGFPREEAQDLWREMGYRDDLLDVGEPFGLWVIEGPEALEAELPLARAGLPVVFTRDVTPYKQRKVRILNGVHTALMPVGYLAGKNTVGECLADPLLRRMTGHCLNREILPTLDMPQEELRTYADSVLERFENPFNRHALLSIALNSISKFRARVLPSLLAYQQRIGALPPLLTLSLVALIFFYRGRLSEQGTLVGDRNGELYPIVDDQSVIDFFLKHRKRHGLPMVREVLENTAFWGQDLNEIPGLCQAVADLMQRLRTVGVYAVLEDLDE